MSSSSNELKCFGFHNFFLMRHIKIISLIYFYTNILAIISSISSTSHISKDYKLVGMINFDNNIDFFFQ